MWSLSHNVRSVCHTMWVCLSHNVGSVCHTIWGLSVTQYGVCLSHNVGSVCHTMWGLSVTQYGVCLSHNVGSVCHTICSTAFYIQETSSTSLSMQNGTLIPHTSSYLHCPNNTQHTLMLLPHPHLPTMNSMPSLSIHPRSPVSNHPPPLTGGLLPNSCCCCCCCLI